MATGPEPTSTAMTSLKARGGRSKVKLVTGSRVALRRMRSSRMVWASPEENFPSWLPDMMVRPSGTPPPSKWLLPQLWPTSWRATTVKSPLTLAPFELKPKLLETTRM